MANLRTDNLCGEGGRNAIRGSVVFGGGDNSAAGLTIADNSELELSSETHWTIEFWIWLNGAVHGDYDVVLGKGSATGNNYEYFVEVMSDNTLEFLTTSTGSAWTFQQQISPVLSHDSWHHVAIVRNGSGSNSLKSYINGQEYGSFTAQSIHTSAYPFGIGYFAGGNNLYSKITLSNLRICKGHAVYTANFTPPFYELKSHYIDGDDKTVLLCCQDSDNPLQEATGKTITGVGHLANGAVIHPKNVPPYGVDAGNTFNGAISMNSSAYMHFQTGRTEERGRGRAIFAGGARSPFLDIQALDIASGGIAQDFGDLLNTAQLPGSASSTTRMLVASGYIAPGSSNVIEFITIANIASSTDFGDLTEGRRRPQGLSNSTRAAFVGGQTPTAVNTIDFVTIQSLGNAADFGDTNASSAAHGAAVASSTRGVYTIGGVPSYTNTIEFITIATAGNGQDFGDLTVDANRGYQDRGSICDTTRGIFSGGFTGSNVLSNTIEFITMATTGNSTNFGDLPVARRGGFGTSNSRLAIFAGGYTPGSFKNAIDQVTIQTTGNATDFGDLVLAIQESSGSSDSHGGLS